MGETFRMWNRLQGLVCAPRVFIRRANRTSAWSVTRRSKDSPVMAKHSNVIAAQNFDYFLVLDFEATCDNQQPLVPQVIRQF